MYNTLQPGKYVIAVSGGVDSMTLLDMLVKEQAGEGAGKSPVRLIVAHYDHGIRPDSAEDRRLVEKIAKQYRVPFVYSEGQLGESTSEATARKARYEFLHTVREQSQAQAVLTAHHQDDIIETALLNVLRGTHRRGMTSLKSTDIVKRPLLHVPKKRIVSYARANGLVWREDSTNSDMRYKRNAVRHQVVAKLNPLERQHILAHIRRMHELNQEIDTALSNHLHIQPDITLLDRRYLIQLPHAVGIELLAAWLRRTGIRDYDRRGLQRMLIAAKTYAPGRRIDVNSQYNIEVNSRSLALVARNR